MKSVILFFLVAAVTASAQSTPGSSRFVDIRTVTPEPIASNLARIHNVSTNLWTFNALYSYDPEWGSDVFYITSFVIGGIPPGTGQLIELDPHRNRAVAWTIPTGIGSWGIIKAKDGNIYMGSYNGGKLLCFNPRTKSWLDLPQLSDAFRKDNSIVTDIAEAPDGNIYYGTFPSAHLVRYDPLHRTIKDLGKVADENYVRWIAVTPSGIVLCGVGPRHARVVAYDPRAGTYRTITPESEQTAGAFARPLASDKFVFECQHFPGGKVLVYDPVTLRLLHTYPVPLRHNGSGNQSIFTLVDATHVLYQDDNLRLMSLDAASGTRTVIFDKPGTAANNRWYFDRKGNLLGLLVQSYVYVDRSTGAVTHQPIPLPHPGQDTLWLNTAPDGTIWGGPPFGQNIFSYQPATHQLTAYDQVVDRTGEIYYAVPYHGRIYSISYAEAMLSVLDPQRDWAPGYDAASNPRTILFMGEDQYRPVGGIHVGPGDKLYIGTQPDYGLVGGALSVFDPATEKIEIMRNIIPQEEISAVATDEHFVYCESDPTGGGGSVATATTSHFFVWDPHAHRIVFDHTFPANNAFHAIATVNGHTYFAVGHEILDYDSAHGTLSALLHSDHALAVPAESLKAASDGTIFGIFNKQLGRITPSAHSLTLYPETAGRALSGLAIGIDGTIYFGDSNDMLMFTPPSPAGPAAIGN